MSNEQAEFRINPVKIRDEVYRFLRSQIVSHTYPPGFRFDLTEIEEQLGISRTPLKEALQRLESEGLVDIRPRRGTYVTQIHIEDVLENYQVRHALESYAAKNWAAEASEVELEELSQTIDEMRSLAQQDDYPSVIDEYIYLDRALHAAIVGLTKNNRLQQIYDRVNIHVQIPRVRHLFSQVDLLEAQSEHDSIQTYIEDRDTQGLLEALDFHIEKGVERMTRALEQLGPQDSADEISD